MILRLNGIEADCVIGERPDERNRLQRLLVGLELEIDDCVAATDRLSDTVDYAVLTERVRAALAAAGCRMIERAAKVVCETCLADPHVRSARASVLKAGAVPCLASAEAVLEMKRVNESE